MSKKPVVIKTYGRHKYRTVKAQTWLSPEEAVYSPFGNRKQPTKIESASTNFLRPKTSVWGKPAKRTTNYQQKPYNAQNNLFRSQALKSYADNSDKENSPTRLLDKDLSDQSFILVNDTVESDILANDTAESDHSSCQILGEIFCVQDSKECSISPDCGSLHKNSVIHSKRNSSNNSFPGNSFNVSNELHNSVTSPRDIVANGLENGNCSCSKTNTSGFGRHPPHVTSTPLCETNSTSIVIRRPSSKSNCKKVKFLDGKVVLKPLRITPIQWKKCLSAASSEKPEINRNSFHTPPNIDQNEEHLQSSGRSAGGNSSLELVVSLEKLRITPLKKRRKTEKCQLSFVEALTPAKKTQSDQVTIDQLSAFDKVLAECDQEAPVKFTDFLDSSLLESYVKIGEGVYGEVFKAQYENGESIALKIIPVEGDFPVNDEPQKSFEEILPEIVISKELSLLGDANKQDQSVDNLTASFITVHSVTCCRDKYPKRLISEWDKWNKENTSENDRPDIFPSEQYFIVFEFSNGGRDLEGFEFGAMAEAWSVLHQTALGLAVAENALEFEHRDLHWGNVLISGTEDEFIESCLLGERKIVPTHGVRVSLIDFTLSRLKKDGVTVFCNLAEDESLFTGKGDYQFDVYRLMKKTNQNDWEPFEPHSNVLWLHYLADKMLKKKKYAAKDKDTEAKLRRFLRQARKCSSATEIVDDFFDKE